jgi:hypothetical protein
MSRCCPKVNKFWSHDWSFSPLDVSFSESLKTNGFFSSCRYRYFIKCVIFLELPVWTSSWIAKDSNAWEKQNGHWKENFAIEPYLFIRLSAIDASIFESVIRGFFSCFPIWLLLCATHHTKTLLELSSFRWKFTLTDPLFSWNWRRNSFPT